MHFAMICTGLIIFGDRTGCAEPFTYVDGEVKILFLEVSKRFSVIGLPLLTSIIIVLWLITIIGQTLIDELRRAC